MADKKEIGQAFKEQLDQVNTPPDDAVWSKITDALDKKKDKKRILVLPLWLKISGIAAGLTLLISLGVSQFSNSIFTNEKPIVVSEDKTPDTISDQKESDTPFQISTKTDTLKDQSTEDVKNEVIPSENTNKNVITSEEKQKMQNKQWPENTSNGILNTKNNDLAEGQSSIKSNIKEPYIEEITSKQKLLERHQAITTENNQKPKINESRANKDNPKQEKETKTTTGIVKEHRMPINELEDSLIFQRKTDAVVITKHGNQEKILDRFIDSLKNDTVIAMNKKNIFEEIKKDEVVLDSLEDIKRGRWSVATQVAPVYYSTLSSGSSLDASLSNNTSDPGINLSYGIQLQYAISEKLILRGGVGRTSLSYTTSNIGVDVSDPNTLAFSGIDIDTDAFISPITLGDESLVSLDLLQKITYYEFPLELSYGLINKKIGLDLIGGFSTLVLDSSLVTAQQENSSFKFGEQNNLNTISFSGNIGLGVDYALSNRLSFGLEPILKIQLNPYSNNTGNFKPYLFGVYTGLRYKF